MPSKAACPPPLGARVRRSDGNINVTDGPFSESKEVVGGLAIIQANSKEEAIAHVKNFLNYAGDGECELRQLYEAPQAQSAGEILTDLSWNTVSLALARPLA